MRRRAVLLLLLVWAGVSEARGLIPVPGIVPEKSYTWGPAAGFEFGRGPTLNLEGTLARRVYWASLSGRLLLGEKPSPGLALDLGLNMTLVNFGLGYRASLGETLDHGPSFWLGGAVPIADIQKDGFKLLGATPFLEPYYRFTLLLGDEGGPTHELGLGFRLWHHGSAAIR